MYDIYQSVAWQALIYSRANINLMDYQVTGILQLSEEQLPQLLSASDLDGRLLCRISRQTSPVTLMFKNGHQEKNVPSFLPNRSSPPHPRSMVADRLLSSHRSA